MLTDKQVEGAKLFIEWLNTLDQITLTPRPDGHYDIPVAPMFEEWQRVNGYNAAMDTGPVLRKIKFVV